MAIESPRRQGSLRWAGSCFDRCYGDAHGSRWGLVVCALAPFASDAVVGAGCGGAVPPNVIVIMTDDQTAEQMRFLPITERLLGQRGTTFDNSFVNFPLCCPSRSTFLTGQVMHNHGVRGNKAPTGGYGTLDHTETLPVWLQRAGYATGHVGKYLNGYGLHDAHQRPPGWTEWYGGLDFYKVYGYSMNRNGVLKTYGYAAKDYQTDVVASDAVSFITRRSAANAPFFLSVAPSRRIGRSG